MRGWSELWHQFIVTLTQQPVAVVLAVWTGLALVVVMALEGLILNLFPGCVFRRYCVVLSVWPLAGMCRSIGLSGWALHQFCSIARAGIH